MKKRIALLLALVLVFSLTACGGANNANDLMKDVPAKAVDVLPDMDAGAAAAADFGVKLFQNSMEEGENTLISPLSVLYALAMTANGADGETLAQMEQVLGMDTENLNSYMRAYLDLLPEAKDYKLSLANSIWFKDDPNFAVEQSFLQTNADYYGAGAYKAAFDEATKNDINNWVKEHTDGMIPEIIDEIPDEAIMYLVNALAFDAEWAEVYEEFQIREGSFTTEAGVQQDVDMMHSEEHAYLEDDMATGFIKYYKDRKYAFAALLPNEGVSVSEYVSGLSGAHLQELLSAPQDITVYATMPKFETEYSVEMSEVLQEMGMKDAFTWQLADFSRLGSYDAEGVNIYINKVLHKTFISVFEQGTRAGAATAVVMEAGGAAMDPEYKEVVLDRPFVYMLIDRETNLPFFIGTMMDVEAD
ncbi:MAG: serpin family protein [Oscillospiraceae bacterium]|nr:serpin family protein [Oscillospiraceae bacterium]